MDRVHKIIFCGEYKKSDPNFSIATIMNEKKELFQLDISLLKLTFPLVR